MKLIRVPLYEDEAGRRRIDIEGEHEPAWASEGPEDGGGPREDATRIDGRRVEVGDLVDAGLVGPGESLVLGAPPRGATYRAALTEEYTVRLSDGREYTTPSAAATHAAGVGS